MANTQNKSLSPRHLARVAAVQAVYQIEQNPAQKEVFINQDFSSESSLDLFELPAQPNIPLYTALTSGLVGNLAKYDDIIRMQLSTNWKIERLPSISRAILRCACFEFDVESATDSAVIINEYVEIAKSFLENKDVKFINGILDKLSKQLRKAEILS